MVASRDRNHNEMLGKNVLNIKRLIMFNNNNSNVGEINQRAYLFLC